MSTADIVLGGERDISLAPGSEAEEILQNVKTILGTVKGTVPLDRDFGIDGELLDQPVPVAEAKLTGKIVSALKKYEPRVEVLQVKFKGDDGGRLMPVVTVKIDD